MEHKNEQCSTASLFTADIDSLMLRKNPDRSDLFLCVLS